MARRRRLSAEKRKLEHFRGILWLPWVVILLMIVSLIWTLNYVSSELRTARVCKENLRRLYSGLELHEFDRGELPELAFFPATPKVDADSMRVVLEGFGLQAEDFLCPNAPDKVKHAGLSYLWNRELNAETLHQGPPRWMMIEIHGMSDKIPGPHFGKYHILYTDGTIEHTDRIPPGLRGGL